MIGVTLTQDADAVLRKLKAYPAAMARSVAAHMDQANQLTVGHIQKTKLTDAGPKYLNVRTNRLRGSARATKAKVQGSAVESAIGSNVVYAGLHEFGWSGSQTVPAHRRKVASRDSFSLRGSPAIGRSLATALGAFGKGGRTRAGVTQQSSGVAFVKAHTRQMRYRERSMFRDGIAEQMPTYSRLISAAITSAWEAGK